MKAKEDWSLRRPFLSSCHYEVDSSGETDVEGSTPTSGLASDYQMTAARLKSTVLPTEAT